MKQNRIEWIDVLKSLVMLLVVIGHAVPKDTPQTLGYYIYSFHMPLFFMISGMTFYLQLSRREFEFTLLVKNKAKALLQPYLILSFMALPIWILNFKILSKSEDKIINRVIGIFYGNENAVSSPSNAMWFCLVLFMALIAFWAVNRWAEGNEKHLTLMVLIIALFGYTFSLDSVEFPLPWKAETVPMAMLFLLMGWLFIKYKESVTALLGGRGRQFVIAVISLVVATCCAMFNVKISMALSTYGSFMMFMGAVIGYSLVCFIIAYNLPALNLFKLIGRNTIVMLAFHAPIFRFLEMYSQTTAQFFADNPVITAIGVYILLIPVCWIFERYLPFAIGKTKTR